MPTRKPQPRPGGAGDPRIFAPATQRNRAPILDLLARALPRDGLVLEIASGSGEHGAWFVPHLPAVTWQPSDPDPECRRSIAARMAELACPRFLPPLDLTTIDREAAREADIVSFRPDRMKSAEAGQLTGITENQTPISV